MIRPRLLRLAFSTALALAAAAPARGQTWLGSGTDWNTAANWSPATVPNSTTAIAILTGGTGAVNISSSVTVQSLNFNSQSVAYNLNSSANQTLTIAGGAINVAAGASGGAISLANVAAGSLLFEPGNLTINNNGFFLALGSIIGTPGTGGVIVNGPGLT